jgi:acetylglutamate kinase
MKLVIKIGGKALEDRAGRREVARQVGVLCRSGHKVVVVHGGGQLLTETLARLGIPTEFHNGLRVTDAASRDVALMVLAGVVNKQWVAELEANGQPALGICGGDSGLVVARKLVVGSNGSRRDLGFVGRPRKVNPRVLEMAWKKGIVPVVASLAPGPGGEYFNINADDFAAALAQGVKADRLIYLTEAGGVWDAEKRLLPLVKVSEIGRLIRRGVVRDGMIPKLRSCARSLGRNVGEVDILPPAAPGALLDALHAGRPASAGKHAGTRIVKG